MMMDVEETTTSTTTTTCSCEKIVSTLEAMLHQEQAYMSDDYIYYHHHHQQQQQQQQQQLLTEEEGATGPLHLQQQDNNNSSNTIEEDRSKMVGWQYQVADFCRFNRETVAIATCYFDRYLNSSCNQQSSVSSEAFANTDLFQLAAMTCFYTAAKIHEPESFEPWMLSKMSRGLYTPEQVEKMEWVILKAIGWRVNPPTSLAFVREFLSLLPECYIGSGKASQAVVAAVYDLCKFQTELCVRIYEFVPIKASEIALAALLNALESIGMDGTSLALVENFLSDMVKQGGGAEQSRRQDLQDRLYQAVTEYAGNEHTEVSSSSRSSAVYPGARQTLLYGGGQHASGKRLSPPYNTSPTCAAAQIYTTAA